MEPDEGNTTPTNAGCEDRAVNSMEGRTTVESVQQEKGTSRSGVANAADAGGSRSSAPQSLLRRLLWKVKARLRHRSWLFHLWNYVSDGCRYLRYSAIRSADTHTKLRARLIRQYHILEKALALPDPSVSLTRFRIQPFLQDLERYLAEYGPDETSSRAIQALWEVRALPAEIQLTRDLNTRVQDLFKAFEPGEEPSTLQLHRESVHSQSKIDLTDFFFSRHSVRQFDPTPVRLSVITHAVKLAQRTPSVCNRQAWRVHVLDDPELRDGMLAIQGGNRGFGNQAGKALVITCDIGHYLKIGERNQAWVDGGMFSMSLVYALHSFGLGTCCLNWGKDRIDDRRGKRLLGVSDAETIVMLLLVGHLPRKFTVAASRRKNLDEVVVVHNSDHP